MFVSMTGFGSSRHEFSWGTVLCEITSVNHKYQDFSAKLPYELSSLENRIINIMRERIPRGKVKFSAEIAWNPGARVPVIDADGLMNLYQQVRRIAKRNSLEAANDITDLLMIPGVLDASGSVAVEAARENPEVWDKLVVDAIESLAEMKKSEGEKLGAKILEELNKLDALNKSLEERWNVAKSEAIEALRLRIENVMQYYNLEIDAARIAQEITLMSDRWDVAEEITRLSSHINKFRLVMKEKDSYGKKIDFLLQEMNREVNTMGSKVPDAEFRWQVVEAKTCIERMREQIQNIE